MTSEAGQTAVQFNATRAEMRVIGEIADRAVKAMRRYGIRYGDALVTKQDVMMDLDATHSNGCPLRLADLLNADDFNFAHDISGISRHLDRDTGKLRDCFVPRFADMKRIHEAEEG